ncbi:MAG: hypothetical protein SFW36_03275 [Leptolyngbyaceae cyanobacterium bins.59]|nr:hypothetical protein [Leptolyngbyaceae cyanobacterium bins.59]
MKRLVLGTLSVLMMSVVAAPIVKAESPETVLSNRTDTFLAQSLYAPRTQAHTSMTIAQAELSTTPDTFTAQSIYSPRSGAKIPMTMVTAIRMSVSPFNLVFLAYQGFLESEGIPKYARLGEAHASRRVGAKDLVKAAVKMNRLPESALKDEGYLEAVEFELNSLHENN